MKMYSYIDNLIKKLSVNDIDITNYTGDELLIINNMIKNNSIIETDNSNILFFIGVFIHLNYKDISDEYYRKANNYNDNDNDNIKNYYHLNKFINEKNKSLNFCLKNYTNVELTIIDNIIKSNNIIETNNSNILYFIGLYIENDYKNIAIKYYKKAAENNNNKNALYYYAFFTNDIEEKRKYYLKSIELNNSYALKFYLSQLKLSNLEIYIDLSSIKLDITKNKIIELEKDRDILIYKNKLKNCIIKECELCFESKENIQLNCFNHMVCTDCYPKVYNNKCPFCRL